MVDYLRGINLRAEVVLAFLDPEHLAGLMHGAMRSVQSYSKHFVDLVALDGLV